MPDKLLGYTALILLAILFIADFIDSYFKKESTMKMTGIAVGVVAVTTICVSLIIGVI